MICYYCGIKHQEKTSLCANCYKYIHRELDATDHFIELWQTMEGSRKKSQILHYITDYFNDLYIEIPDNLEMELPDEWHILVTSKNKRHIYKALKSFKKYATHYYNQYIPKAHLPNVTLATIKKTINKTWYGTRIDELGMDDETTSQNIRNGFVSVTVLQYLIDKVFIPDASQDVRDNWDESKVMYIRNILKTEYQKIIKEE